MSRLSKLLCILLLLPLLHINIRDSHNWGDDFAQYLMQARNIVEGKSQKDNGLVFDSRSGEYALQAYPVGFPLLLAPVYHQSGLSIRPYLLLLSAMLLVLGFLLFHYLKNEFGAVSALALVLLFIYNPWTLQLKTEILSEIPFTLFLFVLILFYSSIRKNPSTWKYWIAGLLCGWIASIRAVGWISIPAIT